MEGEAPGLSGSSNGASVIRLVSGCTCFEADGVTAGRLDTLLLAGICIHDIVFTYAA